MKQESHTVERQAGATSFLRALLPKGLRWEVSGPRTETIHVGHAEENGYVIEFQIEEAAAVQAIFLTLYGNTSAADAKLRKLCDELHWKLACN